MLAKNIPVYMCQSSRNILIYIPKCNMLNLYNVTCMYACSVGHLDPYGLGKDQLFFSSLFSVAWNNYSVEIFVIISTVISVGIRHQGLFSSSTLACLIKYVCINWSKIYECQWTF